MGRIDKNELGLRQQMIMQCVWDAGGKTTVPDIARRLKEKEGVSLSGSAINTMVILLIEKGMLRQTSKISQAFVYEATMSLEEFQVREMNRIRKVTFQNSPTAMAEALMKSNMTDKEFAAVKKVVSSYKR